MPRQKRMRRVSQGPKHNGFRAVFPKGHTAKNDSIQLHLEEYESIKLMDYELHSQEEAADYMRVSRPTITRIYESARRKIAQALIEGRNIEIGGGKFEFDDQWIVCPHCHARFLSNFQKSICPWCSKDNASHTKKEDEA